HVSELRRVRGRPELQVELAWVLDADRVEQGSERRCERAPRVRDPARIAEFRAAVIRGYGHLDDPALRAQERDQQLRLDVQLVGRVAEGNATQRGDGVRAVGAMEVAEAAAQESVLQPGQRARREFA